MSKEKARTKNLSMPSEYQRLLRKIAVIEDRNESSSVRQMIMDRAVQLGLVKPERPSLGYSNPAAAPANGAEVAEAAAVDVVVTIRQLMNCVEYRVSDDDIQDALESAEYLLARIQAHQPEAEAGELVDNSGQPVIEYMSREKQ